MGSIEIDLFASLDLVAQAPGGPEEDLEGGFKFGGWQATHPDDLVFEQVRAGIANMDALLLGRKTYDIFAGYWPRQEDDFAGGIAGKLNSVPKYVASRNKLNLTWAGSSQVGPDIATAIREIRDRHESVHVIGSLDFVQTLLSEKLFDRLNLFVYPIVLGSGKKVFSSGAVPSNLTLAEPAISSPAGTVLLHYELAAGVPATGDMSK
ncbi:MAG: dihydrofolate reductase family protein [Thermomicrobiales bacterium]|jgi:dihydrofolate reductase|nr:dihydrofolate reductase family protein [Thermomicrobiales bacterium]